MSTHLLTTHPATHSEVETAPDSPPKERRPSSSLLRRLTQEIKKRAADPNPEARARRWGAPTNPEQQAAEERATYLNLGWLPFIALLIALGLFVIAYGFAMSRNIGTARLRSFMYPGLILLFAPVAIRLLFPAPSRFERVSLLCITGIACYLVKVITSPTHFYMYDEFLHWRTLDDLIAARHFFTPNALLPVSPFYPGLEIATSALGMPARLDVFHAAILLIGVVRLLMTLTLFLMNEQLFRSSRTASLGTLLYMVNPHYLYFDTQYAYESLALPLALVIFLIMTPYQSEQEDLAHAQSAATSSLYLPQSYLITASSRSRDLKKDVSTLTILALMMLASVTFTHHATDFFFIALLGLWAVTFRFLRITSVFRSRMTWLVIAGIIFAAVQIAHPGNPVVDYLTSFMSTIFSHSGKHFVAKAGHSYGALTWEKNMAQYSTYFTLAVLPFGLYCIWRRYRNNALVLMLSLIALGLHASQLLKTSDNGIQLADRASVVLYIGVSSVLAVLITQYWPIRSFTWLHALPIGSILTVFFLSAYVLSGGSGYGSPPSPYVVGADSRSIEIEGIQAAEWTYTYLGPNNRVGTDRTNQLLMATFGQQRIIDGVADHVDVAPLFFSLPFGPSELALLNKGTVRYLVVDLRLSTSLPSVGVYYEKDEPGALQHVTPVDIKALQKFNTMPKVNRIFDGGDMIIYDMGDLLYAH